MAKLEPLPKYDMGSEIVPWRRGMPPARTCAGRSRGSRMPCGYLEGPA